MNAQAATNIATIEPPRKSVLVAMASKYNMEPAAFEQTLRATVFKDATKEQFAALLVVANQYGLNPLTKEIYAFPAKGGGIQPIVPIDGWTNIINSNPHFDGVEFDDHMDDEGNVEAITARMWRKDRSHPVVVTEYMVECKRGTETWKTWPRRMLRHKALIQCARYAFGFAGIVDPDEAERMGIDTSPMRDVTPKPPAPTPPKPTAEVAEEAPPVAEASATEISADAETALKQIDEMLAAVTDGEELGRLWNEKIEPQIEGFFPPDKEEALGLYRKHERRLEP